MRNPRKRSRYIGIELQGHQVIPGGLARYLSLKLGISEGHSVRVIRVKGRRAIVEIPHTLMPRVRGRWNEAGAVHTHHTWGTLKRAKMWLTSQDGDRLRGDL